MMEERGNKEFRKEFYKREKKRKNSKKKNSKFFLSFKKKNLGYYLQSVPSLLFFDVKRKDFGELLAHHVATIGLVVYSLHVK